MISALPCPCCASVASPDPQPTPMTPLRYRGVAARPSCKLLRRNGDLHDDSDDSDDYGKSDAFMCVRACARAYEQSFWRSHRSHRSPIYTYIPISYTDICVCICNDLAARLRCGLPGGSASSAGFATEQAAAAAPCAVARVARRRGARWDWFHCAAWSARCGSVPESALGAGGAPIQSLRAGRRLPRSINHLGQLCPDAAENVRTSGSCGVQLPLSGDIRHLTARAVGDAVRTRRGATPGRKALRFQRVARGARPPGRGAAAGALDARLYFGRWFLPFGKIFAVRTPGRGGGRVNDE